MDFVLNGSDMVPHSLKDYIGKKVILYFYPKDNTPGCTNEALAFRDNKEQLENYNAVIIGISRDSVEAHLKFINKYSLNFLLLSDIEEKACNYFEVLKEKNMYGKKSIGIERSTFIIDEAGNIQKEFRRVKVEGHVEAILNYLKEI